MNTSRGFAAALVAGAVGCAFAQAVLPGYLTDPSLMKKALAQDSSYQPPERLKYPYVSTYYVTPTVTTEESVKISIFVTDFDSSKIRFLDDSHRFTAYLEYGVQGGPTKTAKLEKLKSGDATFDLGKLPAGDYVMRTWVVDAKGRESHRVHHDFRVVKPDELEISSDKVYRLTAADLKAYAIRNDGDIEAIVHEGTGGTKVVREKRTGVPGYTVTVPLDPKTGKVPFRAYQKATIAYDSGYDTNAVEQAAVATADGLQRLLNEKAAAGFRKVVLLPGTYRLSASRRIELPDRMTLDLNGATLKQNAFTGCNSDLVVFASAVDAHLVNGTLEGDYWTHDYKNSPNNSEWPMGFTVSGDSRYCSAEGVTVVDVTGYGAGNGIGKDARGGYARFYEGLPKFAAGGLDPKTGEVDASDKLRFTTDFYSIRKMKDFGRLQISKYLGYQGRATRSWQMTVCWYDADKKFVSSETAWQYREIWIPAQAAFMRVSIEEADEKAANGCGLTITSFRIPTNCAIRNCRFEHCRCVGYAASAMKNYLFEGNFFTTSGESAAKCAFDAEDGWDQMQDVYFLKNTFRDNPVNNSILTCAGHNFILEKNDCDIHFWGRTHSPCVRDNVVGHATYCCDSRLRSGYGRFERNRYAKGVNLGKADPGRKVDTWDFVLSGLTFDGGKDAFNVDVGAGGRLVGCTFRNMPAKISNAYACTFEKCTGDFYPGGRWTEVTVKDSTFRYFYSTNVFTRCHFAKTTFQGFRGGSFTANDCDFTDCALNNLGACNFRMADTKLSGCAFKGTYWESPGNFLFENCTVDGANPLVTLGVYGLGRIGFIDCGFSGAGAAVHFSDLRPNNQGDGDKKPGGIAMKGCTWKSSAPFAVTKSKGKVQNPKALRILDKGNKWASNTAIFNAADSDVPAHWTAK